MLNEKHRSNLKGTFWNDREILHAVEFEPSGTFFAISEAQVYLAELGYSYGSMCGNEPIGFIDEDVPGFPKWKNLTEEDQKNLDGVILPQQEFREGGVIILFFKPPKY